MKYLYYLSILILVCSCKKTLSRTDQQLLLFAETEDTYDHFGRIDYIDVHQMNTLASIPYSNEKVTLEIEKLKSFIDKFPDYKLERIVEAIDIPCTYRFITKDIDSLHYTLDLALKIPDTVITQVLTKKDLGKEFNFNGLNIKLLKIEGNEAVFRTQDTRTEDVKNKSLLLSDRKSTKKTPAYAQIGDYNEYQQLSIDAISKTSKSLMYESSITDFNHYVHYRKSDIEYDQRMKIDPFYIKLWEVYSHLNYQLKDTYKNLNLVHIRTIGDIESIHLIYEPISDNNIQVKKIGKFKKNNGAEFKYIKPRPKTYETIANLTPEEIRKQLKIRFDNSKFKEQKEVRLYFSLPFNFHAGYQLSLEEPLLISKDDFSESINIYINSYGTNNPLRNITNYTDDIQNNFRFATIGREDLSDYKKINMIANVSYPHYETNIYNLDELPNYITYNSKINSLELNELELIKKISLKYGDNSYLIKGIDKNGNTLSYFKESFFDRSVRYYSDKIETIEVSLIDTTTNVDIPVELAIPKPFSSYIKNFDYDLIDASSED